MVHFRKTLDSGTHVSDEKRQTFPQKAQLVELQNTVTITPSNTGIERDVSGFPLGQLQTPGIHAPGVASCVQCVFERHGHPQQDVHVLESER